MHFTVTPPPTMTAIITESRTITFLTVSAKIEKLEPCKSQIHSRAAVLDCIRLYKYT